MLVKLCSVVVQPPGSRASVCRNVSLRHVGDEANPQMTISRFRYGVGCSSEPNHSLVGNAEAGCLTAPYVTLQALQLGRQGSNAFARLAATAAMDTSVVTQTPAAARALAVFATFDGDPVRLQV